MIVFPARNTCPVAASVSAFAGFRKLILNSIVITSVPGSTAARAAPPSVIGQGGDHTSVHEPVLLQMIGTRRRSTCGTTRVQPLRA